MNRSRNSTLLLCLLFAALALAFGAPAHAHKPSDSYLTLKVEGKRIAGQWDVALRDLDFALGLDANLDGAIDGAEVKAKQEAIAAYAFARLTLAADGAACATQVTEHKVTNHSDGAYAVMYFTAQCPKDIENLDARYSLFFDLDQQHKGLLNLQSGGQARSAIFSVSEPAQRFQLAKPSKLNQFVEYLVEGIWHIWAGFDHILFLLSLLLPAVLRWHERVWKAASSFGAAFVEVLKVVTAFTVAHSITLSLATLGVVHLPVRFAESAIAASVLLAALNNVYPIVHGKRWVVAFAFGLIHGFGFANVLAELGLPSGTLLLALVAFNLGVEVGQIAIVAVFLPIAYFLRDTWFYRRVTLVVGSILIAVLAAAWLVERAFDLKLVPI
jgi:HupE / UreJ protein